MFVDGFGDDDGDGDNDNKMNNGNGNGNGNDGDDDVDYGDDELEAEVGVLVPESARVLRAGCCPRNGGGGDRVEGGSQMMRIEAAGDAGVSWVSTKEREVEREGEGI